MNIYGGAALAQAFRTVRKNTIQIAKDIPAEKYEFRGAEGTMSVRELLAHLAASTSWVIALHRDEKMTTASREVFGRLIGASAQLASTLTTKDEIVSALEGRGEEFSAWLESLPDSTLAEHVTFPPPLQPSFKTRFEMLLGAKEHEMHHRGQLMLIQRMLGMVPHLTAARQAR